jgi:pimeloyl-ACP methyl ester carboxylesterase
MLRLLRIVVGTAFIAYIGLCAALFRFQRSLIYFPQPDSGNNGATMALLAADARVLVSVRPKDGPLAVIYFGGNAEDVSINMPGFAAAFPDHAIYLLHYRGYGGSSGRPSEKALFLDALSLFDIVRATHPTIDIIGRSLGSGIAVYVAS